MRREVIGGAARRSRQKNAIANEFGNAHEDKYFDEDTIASVESFLKNPDAWAEERGYAVPVKQA